uniref:C-type lectin domain-containing protein n=1 Tax=Leptocylindrus danicus TaxID=163516 RepID=A0A7S2JV82_9STRA
MNHNPFEVNAEEQESLVSMSMSGTTTSGASTAAARLQHNEPAAAAAANNNFRENFALKMQSHYNMKPSTSSGNISTNTSNTVSTAASASGLSHHPTNLATPSIGAPINMSYAPPVHEGQQQLQQEQQFTVYPTNTDKRNYNNSSSYTYIGSGDGDAYKQGAMLEQEGNNNNYTTMDYIKEVGDDCFDSCRANVNALPRWVKLGVGAFLCLWVMIVLGEHYHDSSSKGQNSSPSKGDSSKNSDDDNNNNSNDDSSVSMRNHNAMLHNCAAVGNYYFGDPVFEYNGHSYQLIGDIVHYNITNPHGAGFSFFDALNHARSRCVGGKPGYLASIESEEENVFLAGKVKEVLNKQDANVSLDEHGIDVWLGGNDMTNSANFEWLSANSKSDGTVFWKYRQAVSGVYSNFGVRADTVGGENCVRMRVADSTAQWWDESCYKKLAFAFVEFDSMLVPNEL